MNARTPLVIWGAKGQARVLAEFADSAGYRIVALFDNDTAVVSPLDGVPIHHGDSGFERWLTSAARHGTAFAIAIGGDRGRDRMKLQARLQSAGLEPALLVHPTAFVACDAVAGAGSQILARACICTRAKLGASCIVNTAASVDHECEIDAGVHIGPGATLAGCVTVGEAAFIGAGAVVLPRVRIGADAIVAAGAVVTRDVEAACVVAGVPASRVADADKSGN